MFCYSDGQQQASQPLQTRCLLVVEYCAIKPHGVRFPFSLSRILGSPKVKLLNFGLNLFPNCCQLLEHRTEEKEAIGLLTSCALFPANWLDKRSASPVREGEKMYFLKHWKRENAVSQTLVWGMMLWNLQHCFSNPKTDIRRICHLQTRIRNGIQRLNRQ